MSCSGGGGGGGGVGGGGGQRGALVQYLRALLGQKENFTVYFLWKGEHYYIQTRHNDLSFPLQSFSKKN